MITFELMLIIKGMDHSKEDKNRRWEGGGGGGG